MSEPVQDYFTAVTIEAFDITYAAPAVFRYRRRRCLDGDAMSRDSGIGAIVCEVTYVGHVF
jgi:hypothetical protein